MLLDRVLLSLCLLLGLAQLVLAAAPGLVVADRAPPGAIAYLPGGAVTALAVRDDGEQAVVGMADGRVRVFEAGTGREVWGAHLDEAAHELWMAHDGRVLAAGPTRVRAFSIETGELLEAVEPGSEPAQDTAFDPFSGRLLRVTDTGLWEVPLDDLARPPELVEESGEDLVVTASPHGDWVVAGGKDRVARVRASGKVVEVFDGLGGWVLAVDFLPGDRTMVVAGDASKVWIYDIVDGVTLGSVHGHRGWIGALAVSPDGRWLATGGSDEAVRIYDLRTRRLRRLLHGHFEEVRALAFTPDGGMLLSGGDDGQLLVWDLTGLAQGPTGS
jgi:WD40 repeat protein